jgi:hypothetical protein
MFDEVPASKREEQMLRVKRWLKRLHRINNGLTISPSSSFQPEQFINECRDDFLAFFLNCYHLKDWIAKDKTSSSLQKRAIEPYINQTPELRVTADICNQAKHLELDRRRSSSEARWRGRTYDARDKSDNTVSVHLNFYLQAEGSFRDALSLANEAVSAWEKFFALTDTELTRIIESAS